MPSTVHRVNHYRAGRCVDLVLDLRRIAFRQYVHMMELDRLVSRGVRSSTLRSNFSFIRVGGESIVVIEALEHL